MTLRRCDEGCLRDLTCLGYEKRKTAEGEEVKDFQYLCGRHNVILGKRDIVRCLGCAEWFFRDRGWGRYCCGSCVSVSDERARSGSPSLRSIAGIREGIAELLKRKVGG